MEKERPKVGTGVIVRYRGKVLLGKRCGKAGYGRWCFPGGHLEMNEDWATSAAREVREETGLRVSKPQFVTVTNDINRTEGKHYITIHLLADTQTKNARVMEPDKFSEWQWFSWDKLPRPLFLPTRNFVKTGISPFKIKPDSRS